MVVNLNHVYERLKQFTAVFVVDLQFNHENGFIDDYFNVVTEVTSLYSLATKYRSATEKQQYQRDFVGYLLGTETYHSYLERQVDKFNDWIEREPQKVLDFSKRADVLQKQDAGFSPEIRTVQPEEFLEALYHEDARKLNDVVGTLHQYAHWELERATLFEHLDHRKIVGLLRDIYDFKSEDHLLKDVDAALAKWGL